MRSVYFAKRDNWSEQRRQGVLSYPEHLRFACGDCRKEYCFQLVLDKAATSIQSVESVEDLLHGQVLQAQ